MILMSKPHRCPSQVCQPQGEGIKAGPMGIKYLVERKFNMEPEKKKKWMISPPQKKSFPKAYFRFRWVSGCTAVDWRAGRKNMELS